MRTMNRTNRTTTIFLRTASLASLLLLIGAGCDEEIDDPSFQAWCGDELCSWQVDTGAIARVGTWHPSDYGVELTTTPTQLSQVAGDASSVLLTEDDLEVPAPISQETCDTAEGLYFSDTNECVVQGPGRRRGCIEFEVIADVAARAQVQIEVDYGADGTVDLTHPVVASGWEPVSFLAPVPTWGGLTRYRIHKRGDGRAVIAHFGVQRSGDCVDSAPDDNRPLGGGCSEAEQCGSGVCAQIASWQACSECESDASCTDGETCQAVLDDAHPNGAYRTCRAAL